MHPEFQMQCKVGESCHLGCQVVDMTVNPHDYWSWYFQFHDPCIKVACEFKERITFHPTIFRLCINSSHKMFISHLTHHQLTWIYEVRRHKVSHSICTSQYCYLCFHSLFPFHHMLRTLLCQDCFYRSSVPIQWKPTFVTIKY